MSMAARAVSSRAVSSISLAGIMLVSQLCAVPGLARGPPRRAPGAWLPPALALVPAELVLDRVHERLPRGLDDVVRHAHRPPRLVAVARGDEHARPRRRAFGLVEDAHLVVEERHLAQVRVELLEGLA